MVELMQEIGVINKQIQEATQQALSLDERIDASKLGALQLEELARGDLHRKGGHTE